MSSGKYIIILGIVFLLCAPIVEAAKCIRNWRIVDCETVFGNKVWWYCVNVKLPDGTEVCSNCKSGVGGAAGRKHCEGWMAGFDFIKNRPGGEGSPESITAHYGKCEERRNANLCKGQ